MPRCWVGRVQLMYLRTLGNTVSTNSFAHWRAYIHMLLAERAQRRIAHSVASAAQCCRPQGASFTVAFRIRTMGGTATSRNGYTQ